MRKQEFLAQLRKGLSGLPQRDIEERLMFYREMIEDQIEEGLSEEEAVAAVGSVEEIVAQAADIPPAKTAKKKRNSKRQPGAGEIVLLVLGAPIWLSLGIAVFSVIISLYISLWAVIISLWAIFASLIGCSIGGILSSVVFAAGGNSISGIAMFAAGTVCAGVSIFMFYGCKAATDGIVILTKKMAIWIKNCFSKKEAA